MEQLNASNAKLRNKVDKQRVECEKRTGKIRAYDEAFGKVSVAGQLRLIVLCFIVLFPFVALIRLFPHTSLIFLSQAIETGHAFTASVQIH